jgi:hypothetical protein
MELVTGLAKANAFSLPSLITVYETQKALHPLSATQMGQCVIKQHTHVKIRKRNTISSVNEHKNPQMAWPSVADFHYKTARAVHTNICVGD